MSFWADMKEKMKKIKGAEWALLCIVIGVAGSFFLSPDQSASAPQKQTVQTADISDPLEARIVRVLSSIEGAGKVEMVIHYQQPEKTPGSWIETSAKETEGKPIGAIVVAEGADSVTTRLELARAVETLLQLAPDSVEIFKMGKEIHEE